MKIDERVLPLIDKYGELANLTFDDSFNFDNLDDFLEMDAQNTYCLHNEYIESDDDFEKIAKLSFQLKDELEGHTYEENQQVYLELSDSHTLWHLTEEIDIETYVFIVEDYLKQFEKMINTEVYALGRSGRHICVDYTIHNAVRFDELCKIQNTLEEELLSEINSGKFNDYI